jgi:hypothetical protein
MVRAQLDWLVSVRLRGPIDLRGELAYTELCHRELGLMDNIEASPSEYSVL